MRNIIILLIVFGLVGLVFAETSYYTSASYRGVDAADIDAVTGASQKMQSGMEWKQQVKTDLTSKIKLTFDNELLIANESNEIRNSTQFNKAKLKMYYKDDNHFVRVQHRNDWFAEEYSDLTSAGGIIEPIQKETINSSEFRYIGTFGALEADVSGKLRAMNYKRYYDYYPEEMNYENETESEFYSFSKISYKVINSVSIFAKGYIKDDLNESDDYDHTALGGGMEYKNNFGKFDFVKGSITYLHNDSEMLASDKEHYFISDLRYTKRLLPNITGYVSFINRGLYDTEEGKMYTVSGMVKVRAKYSYMKKFVQDSYVQAGVKLNPAHDGQTLSLEANQYVYKNIFLNAHGRIAPKLFKDLGGQIEYVIIPGKTVWIGYEYTFIEESFEQNLINAGVTLSF